MPDQDTLDRFVQKVSKDGFTPDEANEIYQLAGQLKDVSVTLAYARMAVSYMRPKLGMVANWDIRSPRSAENIYERTGNATLAKAAENAADKCVYYKVKGDPKHLAIMYGADGSLRGVKSIEEIKTIARLAETHGCGNCAEQAARAFLYLMDMDLAPLDYMRLEGADHAFVVIGRPGNTPVAEN